MGPAPTTTTATTTTSSGAFDASDDAAGVLDRYRQAVARTDALIEAPQTPVGKSPTEIRARAEHRLDRLRRFLGLLDDPHRAYPIVHVGGTSGKGSTAAAIAAILSAAGYRTGLHTSPYLQAATEKLQVDDRLIGPDAFAGLVDEILTAAERFAAAGNERLTYGEVWVALLALHFARERVDVAVIEVGAGGRFDLTNVVFPAVSVVTSVGLDHTVTLGPTIPEIAWHKAGIIKPGAPAVTAVTDPEALPPLVQEADRVGTTLERVVPGETFEVLETGPNGTRWRERRSGAPTLPAPPGRYQAANAATAVAAVRRLAERGFVVSEEAIVQGLTRVRLPGRFEAMPARPGEPRVVLDGAHNPQKIGALAADLDRLLPRSGGARRVLVIGAVEAKAHAQMVGLLLPHLEAIVATSPRVLGKPGLPAAALVETVRAGGFTGPLLGEPEPLVAVERALRLANGPDDVVLVTGSLYVVGHVRERWYPEPAIVLGRTPWPPPAAGGTT
jgi:dihydrofolate synthase / folylpolyglutamate synthase